jgi:L-alanine-DL-glutamate epimerase-like enolase superfamily enzyme
VLHDGRLRVPAGPGLGVRIDEGRLDEVTTSVEVVEATTAG